MREKVDNMKPVPEIGKYYHFWDDGKCSPGRHYICKVEKLIKIKEAKNIMVKVPIDSGAWPIIDGKPQPLYENKTLLEVWIDEKKDSYWLFANETDYIIEISCPEYDENNLYAVRTKNGGWFTMDVQSWWQGGLLDVTEEIYLSALDTWEQWNGYIPYEEYPEANEENYKKRFK